MTIQDYIRAVSNANDTFCSIKGHISLCHTSSGDAIFWVKDKIVHLRILINGKEYILWCFLFKDKTKLERIKTLCTQLSIIKCEYIENINYFSKELIVFDSYNNEHKCDVVLQESFSQSSIEDFIHQHSLSANKQAVSSLLNNIAWAQRDITYNNIRIENLEHHQIKIDNSCQVKISPHPKIKVLHERNNILNPCFAHTGAILFFMGCFEKYFVTMGGLRLLEKENIEKLLFIIKAFGQSIEISALYSLLEDKKLTNIDIANHLEELSKLDFEETKEKFLTIIPENSPLRRHLIEGKMQKDDYLCVNNGKRYFYLDPDSLEEVFDRRYDYAEEFFFSRAVVGIDGRFGLINELGRFVIDYIWEDLVYHHEIGIVVAMSMGEYFVFDPNGKRLSELVFDFAGIPSEDTLPVLLASRWADIDRFGNIKYQ